MKSLAFLFLGASSIAGACPAAGTGYVNIGAEKFKLVNKSTVLDVVGVEYLQPAACDALGFGFLKADVLFGIDQSSGSLYGQWAGLTNYYGGFQVGYEFSPGLEVGVAYAASAVDARYEVLTAHLGARQTSLVLTRAFNDHWLGRAEYRQAYYAPEGGDQLTVKGLLVGVGYRK